jgi:hypothetical protein
MHIPVNIEIKSNQSDEDKIRNFLMPNKLIYVQDIYVQPTNVVGKVTIQISGIVFDNQITFWMKVGDSLPNGRSTPNKGIALFTIIFAAAGAAIAFSS